MSFEVSSKISRRKVGDIVVIALKGKMVIEREEPIPVMEVVLDEIKEGRKKFLLDLQEVEMIDSAGIGELFAVYYAVKEQDGMLRMLHLDDSVGKVLYMAQLHQMVQTFKDEKEAFASFA